MWSRFREVAYAVFMAAFCVVAILYEMDAIPFERAMYSLIVNLFCCLIFKEK